MDSSIFSTNKKFVDEEVAKKKKEYLNDEELTHISNVYQKKKVITTHKLAAATLITNLSLCILILQTQDEGL